MQEKEIKSDIKSKLKISWNKNTSLTEKMQYKIVLFCI